MLNLKLVIKVYSFYLDEAIERFRMYKRCIPAILQADENLGTQGQVQTLCDTCRQQVSNEKYTPLHLAVELDLKTAITNDQLEAFLNASDSQGKIISS